MAGPFTYCALGQLVCSSEIRCSVSTSANRDIVIDVDELFQFLHRHAFIDLVDAGVARPELHHLNPQGRDEASVGRAAAGLRPNDIDPDWVAFADRWRQSATSRS